MARDNSKDVTHQQTMSKLSEKSKQTSASLLNSTKATPKALADSGDMDGVLGQIYQLMVDNRKDELEQRQIDEKNSKTDTRKEESRHQELLKALTVRRRPKPKRVIRREKKAEEKEAAKPTEPAKKPTEPAKKPAETAKKPDEAAKKPAEAAKKPAEAAKKPAEAAKKPAEDTAKKAAEDKAKKAAEDTAKKAAEDRAKKAAEDKAKKEAEDRAKKAAEDKAKKSAEQVKPPEVKPPKAEQVKPPEVKPPPKAEAAPAAPKPAQVKPPPTAATLGKAALGKAALSGKALKVAVALGALGITSKAAIGAIISTSAKESGLDPFKPEDGVKPWSVSLEKRGVDYLYLKFPQLAPGGRVAKELNMPNGVPADYIRQVMAKGDEAWFTLVYPGGADAYKYRGRGLIQITGKGVYKAVGDIIGIDLVKDPDAITRDFDTAAKATGAYLMNSVGRGDSKKGLAALNGLTDEQEALKMVIANVARGGAGADKEKIDKMFDTSTNLGKTTASQLEAASKYTQLGSDAASGKKIDESSKENADLKEKLNKDKSAQTTNNTTTTNNQTNNVKPEQKVDDRPPHVRKQQQ